MRFLISVALVCAFLAAASPLCQGDVSIRQADDQSVEVVTDAYSAKIDAKGNLVHFPDPTKIAFSISQPNFGKAARPEVKPDRILVSGASRSGPLAVIAAATNTAAVCRNWPWNSSPSWTQAAASTKAARSRIIDHDRKTSRRNKAG
ncbi:MAG: hypothetical protein ACKOEX_11110 [Planctomycetia bacterium]